MARILVLAGTNGAGKSSIGGAMIRQAGLNYFNPDEVAKAIVQKDPGVPIERANGLAWQRGKELLDRAIDEQGNFAFETTLGGATITATLKRAISAHIEVVIWYVALRSPELHLARVRARVARGGHDIPEANIRKRYDASRLNLIDLLPGLTAVRVYDNSKDGDPATGAPQPQLLLHMEKQSVIEHCDLGTAPEWVKPILMAALKIDPP